MWFLPLGLHDTGLDGWRRMEIGPGETNGGYPDQSLSKFFIHSLLFSFLCSTNFYHVQCQGLTWAPGLQQEQDCQCPHPHVSCYTSEWWAGNKYVNRANNYRSITFPLVGCKYRGVNRCHLTEYSSVSLIYLTASLQALFSFFGHFKPIILCLI